MTTTTMTFGTRGSQLARCQTDMAADALQAIFPSLKIETIVLSTRGDQELNKPLPEIGGKGLFTAELEAALLNGTIDLAVHSLKDLPTEDIPGLTIGAVLPRASASDILVSRSGHMLQDLPHGAIVGTSSLRRSAQLLAFRSDLQIESIRGNIDTRIAKALDPNGIYDAVVLAAAGLHRLGLQHQISQEIPFDIMLSAPAQGAIAIQCRADDQSTLDQLVRINHTPTQLAVVAERSFLSALDAGCSLPVAALSTVEEDKLRIRGLVASLDGQQVIRVSHQASAANAKQIGNILADKARDAGADALLETIHAEQITE